jgi:hypothetical protein
MPPQTDWKFWGTTHVVHQKFDISQHPPVFIAASIYRHRRLHCCSYPPNNGKQPLQYAAAVAATFVVLVTGVIPIAVVSSAAAFGRLLSVPPAIAVTAVVFYAAVTIVSVVATAIAATATVATAIATIASVAIATVAVTIDSTAVIAVAIATTAVTILLPPPPTSTSPLRLT